MDRSMARPAGLIAASALGIALLSAPAAHARVGVFVGVGPFWPYYYPPPVYVSPPAVYAPPPVQWYTAPPSPYPAPHPAQSCNAGAYICPMETTVAPGTSCWCRDNQGGRTYGRAS